MSRVVELSHMPSHTVGTPFVWCASSVPPPLPLDVLWPSGRSPGECCGGMVQPSFAARRRQGHHKRHGAGSRPVQNAADARRGSCGRWFATVRWGSIYCGHHAVCALHTGRPEEEPHTPTEWLSHFLDEKRRRPIESWWSVGVKRALWFSPWRWGAGGRLNPVLPELVGQKSACGDFGGALCCHAELPGLSQCRCWSGRGLKVQNVECLLVRWFHSGSGFWHVHFCVHTMGCVL